MQFIKTLIASGAIFYIGAEIIRDTLLGWG